MNYETIAIFKVECSADYIEKISEKIEKAVGEKPGKFVTKKDWGNKRLSYEIQKEKQGHYYSWKFGENASSPAEVDKLLRYEEDILRYATFRLDREETLERTKEKSEGKKKQAKIDFRNPITLTKFLSERGKIIPRRVSGINAQTQNYVANCIKRARQLALLSYTNGFFHSDDPQGQRSERGERGERGERNERGDRGERYERPDRESRGERNRY